MKPPIILQRRQKVNYSSNLFTSKDDDTATTTTDEYRNSNNNNNSLFSIMSVKNKIVGLRSKTLLSYDNKMCYAFIILLACYALHMFLMLSSLSNLTLLPTINSDSIVVADGKTISVEKTYNKTKQDSRIVIMPEQIKNSNNFFHCSYPAQKKGDNDYMNNNAIYNDKKQILEKKEVRPPCTYINIKDFFDSSNGLGYEYRHLAYEYKQNTIFRDLRFYHIQCNNNGNNNTSTSNILPYNISYIHIHKNGGSTIREAFYNIINNTSSSECKGIIFESPEIREQKITRPKLVRTTSKIMERLSQNQKKYLSKKKPSTTAKSTTTTANVDHVALSFLREPISRFLSSVGETIRQNHIFGCTTLLKSSTYTNNNTAKDTIQCIIKDILSRGTIIETHYTPSAIELYLSDSGNGVYLSLYHMYPYLQIFLNDILKYDNSHINLRSATSKAYNGYFDLSMDDLGYDMVQDICKIYRMDVILLQYIGIPTPYC